MADALRSPRSIIGAACIALFASAAFAQSPDATSIGAINLSYVARTSNAGKAALARIDDAARRKSVEVESRAIALQKQQAQLTVLGIGDRARADLQRTFDKSRTDFARFQEDAQKEIEALQTEFELEFRGTLAPIIDEVSREKGLHFVFGLEQAAIVWWSPAVDISDDVVKRLDAKK
jgi:Skp family chaperone for outer membrane proteins